MLRFYDVETEAPIDIYLGQHGKDTLVLLGNEDITSQIHTTIITASVTGLTEVVLEGYQTDTHGRFFPMGDEVADARLTGTFTPTERRKRVERDGNTVQD